MKYNTGPRNSIDIVIDYLYNKYKNKKTRMRGMIEWGKMFAFLPIYVLIAFLYLKFIIPLKSLLYDIIFVMATLFLIIISINKNKVSKARRRDIELLDQLLKLEGIGVEDIRELLSCLNEMDLKIDDDWKHIKWSSEFLIGIIFSFLIGVTTGYFSSGTNMDNAKLLLEITIRLSGLIIILTLIFAELFDIIEPKRRKVRILKSLLTEIIIMRKFNRIINKYK